MSILIGIFTFVLIIGSVFLVLLVRAQKAKTDGGMGAALGGGATEAAFGADTGNVLTKLTQYAVVIFFLLTFGLYLGHIYVSKHGKVTEGQLPTISESAETSAAPAAAPVAVEATATAPAAESAPAVTLPVTEPAATAPAEAAKP